MRPKATTIIHGPWCDGLGSPQHWEFSVPVSRMSGESTMYPKLKTAAAMGVVLTGLFGLVRTGMVVRLGGDGIPQVPARRNPRHRRGTPVRDLFLPDRSAGLPARRYRKTYGRLAARRRCHFLSPQRPGKALVLAAAPSRADRRRPGTHIPGPDHRPLRSPPEGCIGRLRDHRSQRSCRIHGDIQGPARVRRHDGAAPDRAPGRGRGGPTLHLRPWLLWLRLLREPGT